MSLSFASSEMATGSETQESNTSPELPTELPYDFLKTITDNFADERKISASPFGTVYKGVVPDADRVIAVKKLHEDAPIPAGKTFSKEVHHVLPLRHENIVQLVGFCNEATKKLVQMEGRYIQADIAECLLCYEYLPNGSLDHYLFGMQQHTIYTAHIYFSLVFLVVLMLTLFGVWTRFLAS